MSAQSTKPKYFCFVLMPFDPKFNDTYQLGVKQACSDAGAYCERVDEQNFEERILDRIYNQIAKADLVVADMTDRNPNVFYEVGYAHALGKPTVLLTRSAEDIPFDLKHFQHIVYGDSISRLKLELTGRVRWFMDQPRDTASAQFPVDVFLDSQNLAVGDAVYSTPSEEYPFPRLTVRNTGTRGLASGAFKVALVCGDEYPICTTDGTTTVTLPDGRIMHVHAPIDYLFPEEATPCGFNLRSWDDVDAAREVRVTVRVFTEAGMREFPLVIRETA